MEQVVIKVVEPKLVAASLGIIPDDRGSAASVIIPLFAKTYQYLINQGITDFSSPICIYHDLESRNHQNIPIEIIVPISEKISGTDNIWIYELPKLEQVASIIHRGSLSSLENAYNSLLGWIEKNNYRIIGSIREVYLEFDADNQPIAVEVQFPVDKI